MKRARSASLGSVDGSEDVGTEGLRENADRAREGLKKGSEGIGAGIGTGIAGTAHRAKDALPPAVTDAPSKAVHSAKLLVGMVGLTRLLAGAGSTVVAAGTVWGVVRAVRARRARNRGLRGLWRRVGGLDKLG